MNPDCAVLEDVALSKRRLRQWSTCDLISLASRGWEACVYRRVVQLDEMSYGRSHSKEFFMSHPYYDTEIHAYVLGLINERIA